MCMCVSVCAGMQVPAETREVSDPWELELQGVVSCLTVGGGY